MYEELFQELNDNDAEVEATIARLNGSKDIYAKYLFGFPKDPSMAALKRAVADGDSAAAELAVHTLKGLALNLGLPSLLDACMDMLLDIRAGNIESAFSQLGSVERAYTHWIDIIQKYAPGK